MQEPICSRCGSTSVLADAYAQWDNEAQDWTLQNTFDDSFCEECVSDPPTALFQLARSATNVC